MPTLTFTAGNDSYEVAAAGNYDLSFLAGDDTLTTRHAGATTTATMGDGNDVVSHRAGTATVIGGTGADRFEVYASGLTADGGDDNDLFNVRGGSSLSLTAGAGNDRFNFYAASALIALHGDSGNDDFFGYGYSVTGDLYGGIGDDYFVTFSNASAVNLRGEAGNDVYRYHAGSGAVFVESINAGIDSVQVARGISYALPANIERISVSGFSGFTGGIATLQGNGLSNTITAHNNVDNLWGHGGDDRLFGKGAIDTLYGGTGNDYLDGGTGDDILNGNDGNDVINGRDGSDTMSGGVGDDTYYVDSLGDLVTEAINEGTDIIRISVSGYTLTGNIETGIVFGSAGIVLNGNELNNLLIGNGGNDTLDGGAGVDSLYGGMGDDSYVIDNLSDGVVENVGEGTDTVHSSISGYSLPDNIENGLVTAGNLYGNNENNVLGADGGSPVSLYGNYGNDTLNGSSIGDTLDGGYGDDVATGGAGNDFYWVDSVSDQLIENAGEGTDSVTLSVSGFTLPANVENGSFSVYIAGGTIYGSDVDNILTGKAIADVLHGAGGNDTLYGHYEGDTLSGGDGNDALFGYYDGYDAGFGNDFNNVLNGDGGNDVLTGGRHTDTLNGGTGADSLWGGAGADTFDYNAASESTTASWDTIQDFTSGSDKIDLSTIDANPGVGGDQAFTFVFVPAGAAGEAYISSDATHTYIFLNVDGGDWDMRIDVVGFPSITDIIW